MLGNAGHFHLLAAWPHGDDSGLQTPIVDLAKCVVSALAVGAGFDHDVWRCGKNGLLLTDAGANVEWAGDRAVTLAQCNDVGCGCIDKWKRFGGGGGQGTGIPRNNFATRAPAGHVVGDSDEVAVGRNQPFQFGAESDDAPSLTIGTALVARINELAAELEALNQAEHIEKAREALANAARRAASDEELSVGDALRRASDGSDEAGQARTIAEARKAAAEAELTELEASERERQKRVAAAQVLTVGEMTNEAKAKMRDAFREAFRLHCRLAALMDKRFALQAQLSGVPKSAGCSPANLFTLPQPGEGLHGNIIAPAGISVGFSDPLFKQTAEIEAALAEVQPIRQELEAA